MRRISIRETKTNLIQKMILFEDTLKKATNAVLKINVGISGKDYISLTEKQEREVSDTTIENMTTLLRIQHSDITERDKNVANICLEACRTS